MSRNSLFGVSGWYDDALFNYAEWMKCIEEMVLKKENRIQMGEGLYQTIVEKYDINKTITLWVNTYKQLLES